MGGGWTDGGWMDGWIVCVCVRGGGGIKLLHYQYVACMHGVINRTHGSNVL